jgi:pilus assembly protein CpaE
MNSIARLSGDSQAGFRRSPAIIAFARDEVSRAVLAEVLEVAASTISPGGIEEATSYMAHDPSSHTVIVDLSGIAEPLLALDHLAENCLPDTRVITIGEVNDIHFYRSLRSAGVAEYLVKPLTADSLRTALTAPVILQAEPPPLPALSATAGETIAVVGARGGVGATMVAVSLAWLATNGTRRKTVLADLDLTCGAASLALDVESGHGLTEALANPDRIDSMLLAVAAARVGEHLHLLSSEQALDGSFSIQPDAIEKLGAGLRQGFQRVIFDVPRSDGAILKQAFAQATIIVIVTDFSIAGVRDTGRLVALAQKIAPAAKRLVVGNRGGVGRKGDLTRAEIEKALGLTMACVIPEDSIAVPQALNSGKPVPDAAPSSPVTAVLRELGALIDGAPLAVRGGLLSRLLASGVRKGAAAKKG